MDNRKIELLAPAKDLQTAIAAVDCGADAIYIGGPRFGAREAAGNSITDIQRVIEYANPYFVKVYVALNTLLYDEELPAAERLIHDIYNAGANGLIIQDMGLLELDLPPIPLIASTQTNNATPEKVKFLEDVGFSRVILARELTLDQIRQIRRQTSIELECFIHGALCVSASGLCYMSYALGGRSGNRGSCAQPCRRLYTLKDKTGKTIARDRYLLSIKDLNLSEHIESMIDAGVTSFKIEGRLKDADYVSNIVAFYRRKIDEVLTRKGLRKSSSGMIDLKFTPDPAATFNRGYTDYGIDGSPADVGAMDTPKSIGQYIGIVETAGKDYFILSGDIQLHNADGICFFDSQNNLCGTQVNRANGNTIYPRIMDGIFTGQKLYRNFNYQFAKALEKSSRRKIKIDMILYETKDRLSLTATDEDGITASVDVTVEKQLAQKPEQAKQTIQTQLSKLGNTIFECKKVTIETPHMYFLTVSSLNELRRNVTEKILQTRIEAAGNSNRQSKIENRQSNVLYPEKHLSYLGNVLNKKAETFYRRHGVEIIEPAAESGLDLKGRLIMTTKYCLREQLGLCPKQNNTNTPDPLTLIDENANQFRIEFRCGECGMNIYLD